MPPTPEQVVRAFYEAWDVDGFAAAFAGYFSGDGVWQNNADPPRVGIEAIMEGVGAYLTTFKRPYAHVDIVNLAVNGDVVLTERIERCENRDTGDSYTGHHMSAFTVRDGKIVRWADYFDPTDYRNGSALPP